MAYTYLALKKKQEDYILYLLGDWKSIGTLEETSTYSRPTITLIINRLQHKGLISQRTVKKNCRGGRVHKVRLFKKR